MNNTAELVLILLCAMCLLACLAQRLKLAYPILFVLGGMALAALPGFPAFQISPELLLLLFLPPILTEAAYFSSLRDLKDNARPILQLAFGLVIATCLGTAFFLHWLLPWISIPVGFVLGAIISPPDAVAAVSMTRGTRIPKRLMTMLEGESLINDATGLVLYKFAVVAVVTGSFSLYSASIQFVWMAVAGIGIGWLLGWVYMHFFPFIKERSVEILSTFLVPYASYLLAEWVHGSGVLAVVATGLTVGWYAPKRFTPALRVPAEAVWKMVIFILNGLVFLLIGLHFTSLLKSLSYYSPGSLLWMAIAVSLIAIVIRVAWVFIVGYGTRWMFPAVRKKDPYPPWQNVFIVAWTGMRGVVSLATALALPLTIADGTAFPHRDLIIFLAFSVILFTLVVQGLMLPWLVNKLSLSYDFSQISEAWAAQKEAIEKALDRLCELQKDQNVQSAAFDRIVSHYEDRLQALGDGPNTPINPKDSMVSEAHPIIQAEQRIWRDVLQVERSTVIAKRHHFEISDDVMHEILRDIDLLYNRFA